MEYNARNAMAWSRLSSRIVFGNALEELIADHPDCVVMVADVAKSSGLLGLKEKYPNQFLNVGIAETNMIAMATAIAQTGKNVFALTFAPFASMRCFEAIRTYVGYMHANVKIVGLASGLSMGVGGNTHFGLEDIALMRTVPGMAVVSPADCTETVKAVEAALNYEGPMYLRLTGVNGNPIVYKDDYDFEIGKGICLREGTDVAVLASGMMVNESLRAARLLSKAEISAAVYDFHTVKPFDTALLEEICKKFPRVVTVEEHSKIGGLGAAVSEFITETGAPAKLCAIALPDAFGPIGSYAYLQELHGLTAKQIAETIEKECTL